MQTDAQVLKIVSNETKKHIDSMDVVTPSIYSTVFSKCASSHDLELKDEEKISKDFLDEELSLLEDMRKQTSKNVLSLDEHTSKAIAAMQNKDETTLKEVLDESQKLKKEIEKLRERIYKDELTDTFNRKWVQDNLLKDDARLFKDDGALAIIDLNYFKAINDTYGHITGDKVLVFVARQLEGMREKVVRFGGDEFMIFFSKNITKHKAYLKLDKVREKMIGKKVKTKNSSFKVSFSFGIAEFKKGEDLSDVTEKADKDMYNDKIQIKKRITGIH